MRVLCVLLLLAPLCGCEGLSNANPTTRIGAGAFSMSDNKDNDITLKKGAYNPDTGQFEIDDLVIRNNASDVRIANVEQMKQINEQLKTLGENLRIFMDGITNLANALPWLAAFSRNASPDLVPPGFMIPDTFRGMSQPDNAMLERLEALESRIDAILETRPSP